MSEFLRLANLWWTHESAGWPGPVNVDGLSGFVPFERCSLWNPAVRPVNPMLPTNEPTPCDSIGSFFRTLFWPKTAGVAAFMTLFFIGYFWALKHSAQHVAIMPLTAVDRLIPFSPWLAPFYFSLWIYVSICAGFFKDFRLLALYGAVAAAIALIGLGIFVAWPTAVPRPDIDWRLYPSLGFLKTVDQSGNACPSLHVAYSIYSAIWVDRLFSEIQTGWPLRLVNTVWCIGIVYSTIAIRQHVAIDVVCGGTLGAVGALAFLSLRRSLLEASASRRANPADEKST